MKRFGRVCATTVTWLPKKMGFLGDFYRIYVKISKPKSQWTIVKMLLNPCLWVSFASVCLHIKDNHWCSILLNENVGDACCSPKKVSEFEFFFLNPESSDMHVCSNRQNMTMWLWIIFILRPHRPQGKFRIKKDAPRESLCRHSLKPREMPRVA